MTVTISRWVVEEVFEGKDATAMMSDRPLLDVLVFDSHRRRSMRRKLRGSRERRDDARLQCDTTSCASIGSGASPECAMPSLSICPKKSGNTP